MPLWGLALTYWLHLMATVVWIGGLAMLILTTWANIEGIERRFRPFANLSLVVLLVTGLIQMGADEHYEGFLIINDLWEIGLLAKHVIIVLMIVVTLILQFNVYPALERAKLLAGRTDYEGETARRRLRQLTFINLGLGVLVLLCTAIITAV
jgi:uncharacterized membrane protein